MDLSGPTAASQSLWVNGLKDHFAKRNEGGGVNGRKLNLLVEDDRFDPALQRIALEKLGNQTPVLGISGLGSANAQVASQSVIRRGKVPILASYTTAKALVQPPTPMFYGGFCGYKEMAEVSVGYQSDRLKLQSPRIATVHLDTAGGKEYADYVAAAAAASGGTSKAIAIKVNAADATPQVLEIIALKPDFITIHGTTTTPILLLRAMQQYGLKIPVIGIAYIGTPLVFSSVGPEAGANFSFVSCFTPGSTDTSPGVAEMVAYADKSGRGDQKDDVNYVAGWVIGQLVADAIQALGPDVSRAALVAMLNKGFSIETRGLSAPLGYTATNHEGLALLRPFAFDYATKQFKAVGTYEDYRKYVK